MAPDFACHDGRNDFLSPADGPRRRFGDLDCLLVDTRVGILPVQVVFRRVMHFLVMSPASMDLARPSSIPFVE